MESTSENSLQETRSIEGNPKAAPAVPELEFAAHHAKESAHRFLL